MADSYQYRQLEAVSTIRLIKLLPDLVDGNIVCAIHHVDMLTAPIYCALSYYWGGSTPTQTIIIVDEDGHKYPHPLDENLWQFLSQM